MSRSGGIELGIAEQVAKVREFNRFYTARLGLLSRHYLDGEYSLTESRILFEIGATPQMTASALQKKLELDAGYLSRLLAAMAKRRLVRRSASTKDGREKLLTLTTAGQEAVARLNQRSMAQIEGMLANVTATERDALVASLTRAHSILASKAKPVVRVVRLTALSVEAHRILHEYYEAVHVVQRDKPGSLQEMIDDPASGIWLAYMGDEVVGCVVLRRIAAIRFASECKRLYVKPAVRGNRIADLLLDAQEEYAREQGVRWIYLDSYDDLKTAITLYERRGYERCKRYNDNPQATLFMRKRVGRQRVTT
jgi:DNA-binding MarR family transcriptional regulator/GNAT superfamily N-acetyltransferase